MRLIIITLALMLTTLCTSANAGRTAIHQHKSKDIGQHPVPRIQLSTFRDAMDGVNINVAIENYVLNAPDVVSADTNAQNLLQGHAHVFVNGEKRQRLYGHNIHIPQSWLRNGVNQVAVSLNSHAHENWTKDGETIVGSVFFDLANESLVLHTFTSQPLEMAHHHH